MKKTIITLVILVAVVAGGIWGWNSYNRSKNNKSNYQAERSNIIYNANKNENATPIVVPKKETEISVFSTKIFNKDEERQNNISIACRTLSTKEIQPGEIFSFCDIVGKATSGKGYQEADIYVEGKKEQGLGGGICQVSTTLYNAVLQVPELEVIEKHEHSGKVPYIQKGRDAAIAYGSYDFKFKNNTNNVIKIVMENTIDSITARLIKIER